MVSVSDLNIKSNVSRQITRHCNKWTPRAIGDLSDQIFRNTSLNVDPPTIAGWDSISLGSISGDGADVSEYASLRSDEKILSCELHEVAMGCLMV